MAHISTKQNPQGDCSSQRAQGRPKPARTGRRKIARPLIRRKHKDRVHGLRQERRAADERDFAGQGRHGHQRRQSPARCRVERRAGSRSAVSKSLPRSSLDFARIRALRSARCAKVWLMKSRSSPRRSSTAPRVSSPGPARTLSFARGNRRWHQSTSTATACRKTVQERIGDDVWGALTTALPELGGVARVMRRSTSPGCIMVTSRCRHRAAGTATCWC